MKVVSGTILALLSSANAYAQTASTAQADEGVAVDEVIVTAARREQSLQDVSIAVSALGAQRLETAQVNNLQDLQTIVPSVNFGNDFNQAKIFIRGVGANTSTTGSSTGVALHVDGAYVARAEAQLTSLFDVDRVEVLRGPQGTLYGRNAVGGSVNIITARPSDTLEGYGRLTIGNYNATVTEVALSGPLSDNIQVRIAGKTEGRDGFGSNPFNGGEIDDLDRRMVRGQVNFDFTPDISLLLSGEYFRQNDSSGAIHYLRASFPGVARLPALGVGGYATDPRDLASEIQPGTSTESYSFTSTFTADVNENLSFTNITNFRSFETSLFQDLDLSAVQSAFTLNGVNSTVQERRIDSEQVSTELQMNYDTEFVSLVLGGYYFEEQQNPIDNVGFGRSTGLPGTPAILARDNIPLATAYALCGFGPGGTTGGSAIQTPKRVCIRSDLQTEATAVFGQTTLNLGMLSEQLSAFSVKLGGRFSNEIVKTENPGYIIRYSATAPLQALPTLFATPAGSRAKRTFDAFTPEAGVQWAVNDDVLVYYTYSEGFKAGSGENAFNSTTIVDPEEITNNELGVKASLLNNRLTLNMAAYSYELKGLQLNKTITGGPAGFTTIFQNAASTSATGVEADFFAAPTDTVRFSGGVSWTDASFDDYVTVDPLRPQNVAGGTPYNAVTNPDPTAFGAPGGGNLQLAGNRVRNTPEWAWNVHGEVDLPFAVPMGGTLTLMGDVSYKSQIFFSEFERDIESSEAYTVFDASLVFESEDGAVSAQLWGKNITDEEIRASTFAVSTGRLIGVTYLPPLTYGLTVGYRF